jgi:hypothetical protein
MKYVLMYESEFHMKIANMICGKTKIKQIWFTYELETKPQCFRNEFENKAHTSRTIIRIRTTQMVIRLRMNLNYFSSKYVLIMN